MIIGFCAKCSDNSGTVFGGGLGGKIEIGLLYMVIFSLVAPQNNI